MRLEVWQQCADVHGSVDVAPDHANTGDCIATQVGNKVEAHRLTRDLVLPGALAIDIQIDGSACHFNRWHNAERVSDSCAAEGLLKL